MNIYSLRMFNTGQITLPKSWRKRFNTKQFIAEEQGDGLLIKPLTSQKNDVVYFEGKEGFGIYCEKGLPVEEIIRKIDEIHGSD